MRVRIVSWAARLVAALLWLPMIADAASGPRHVLDIVYTRVDGEPIRLDLHLPTDVRDPPLVIYLHGGGWRDGNKTQYPAFLVDRGYAVASLDFRSTNDAPFPANVRDIEAGLGFLRERARDYGYDATRIAITGASSGGHLAALVGLTAGRASREPADGAARRPTPRLQAIVSWFGASNLTTILAQSTPYGLRVREPALRQLLGGLPGEVPEVARRASPVFHVDAQAPPLLLLHGDQDPQMPINQMHELEGAYERAGREARTLVLHGVGHDSGPFFTGRPAEVVASFLADKLGR